MQLLVDSVTGKIKGYVDYPVPAGCTAVDVPLPVQSRLDCGVNYVFSFPTNQWEITALGVAQLLAENWRRVRIRRNALLVCTDFTQLPDVTLDHAAWAVYRQALRDVTNQPDPTAITWPTPPDASIIKNVPALEVLL